MEKEIVHDLSKVKAKKAIDKAAEKYSQEFPQYNPRFEWTGLDTAKLTMKALGKTIEASIKLNEKSVTVSLAVPPALKLFESAAMKAIDAEVQVWIKKAKAGNI